MSPSQKLILYCIYFPSIRIVLNGFLLIDFQLLDQESYHEHPLYYLKDLILQKL